MAQGVSNLAPDDGYLPPMLGQIESNLVRLPAALLADAGYLSRENVGTCEGRGVVPYIATGRQRHSDQQLSDEMSASADLIITMKERLGTPKGRALYRLRKTEVELVLGQIKLARGFRRFSLRGAVKVRGEWALVCLIHNVLKLFGTQMAPAVV